MKYILLYSGNPLPAMLEIGVLAAKVGHDVELILVDRGMNDLAVDQALLGYGVTRISSPYNGLDVRRLISFPLTGWQVASRLFKLTVSDAVVITSTFDMLVIARMVAWFCPLRIRHQVRDLHAVQLGHGLLSKAVRVIERWCLKRCELLIYSAPAFYEEYYSAIYSGQLALLENLPRLSTWKTFQPDLSHKTAVKIGYIGIIRYLSPLRNLVDAVECLVARGINISVIFAGGGDMSSLQARVKTPERFEFLGKFEYTSSVANLHQGVDLIFAVYDRFDTNCRLAMPTKFYEALITRIPILVSADTYVGALVERMGVGKAVDGESVDALSEVLDGVGRPDSWHAKAKATLASLDIDDFYARYQKALALTIASEVPGMK